MKTAIYNLLSGDGALMATLTGGLYGSVSEISRQNTPAAFDANLEMLPCALVKQEGGTPWGPHEQSGRLYVTVWFYDRASHTAIEAARKRVYALLHRAKLTPVDGSGCYEVVHGNDLLDLEEPVIGAAMAMSRFVCTVQRG